MRVKPYAIRSPSRNAHHTALLASGGWISTSGCSCRYRSSLRTWSGRPGGTSCTGQYRHPASGQRNGFPKTPAPGHHRYGPASLLGLLLPPYPVEDAFHRDPAHPRSGRVAYGPDGTEQMSPDAPQLTGNYLSLDPDYLTRLLSGAANEIELASLQRLRRH
jgi:hypothetical protein